MHGHEHDWLDVFPWHVAVIIEMDDRDERIGHVARVAKPFEYSAKAKVALSQVHVVPHGRLIVVRVEPEKQDLKAAKGLADIDHPYLLALARIVLVLRLVALDDQDVRAHIKYDVGPFAAAHASLHDRVDLAGHPSLRDQRMDHLGLLRLADPFHLARSACVAVALCVQNVIFTARDARLLN